MDIRGNTFSIEAPPIRKGQPLFLFVLQTSMLLYIACINMLFTHELPFSKI